MFRPDNIRGIGRYQKVAAVIGGVALGWSLVFLGVNIPSFFGFQPITTSGIMVIIFVFFGISFGYHLSEALVKTTALFVFIATFFSYVIMSLFINFPPLFFGGTPSQYAAVAAMPAIGIVALFYAGIIPPGTSAEKVTEMLGTTVSWPIFWLGIGYLYIYPMFQETQRSPSNEGKIVNFIILAVMWVLIIPAAYYLMKKTFLSKK